MSRFGYELFLGDDKSVYLPSAEEINGIQIEFVENLLLSDTYKVVVETDSGTFESTIKTKAECKEIVETIDKDC